MNTYTYSNEPVNNTSSEVIGLVVGSRTTKSLEDVKRAIRNNRPQKGIDATIAAYIPTLDPSQLQADAWYEQHSIVEKADPEEAGKEVPVLSDDGELTYTKEGELITEVGLNTYEKAVKERNLLEIDNPWLGTLRGVSNSPERPAFDMTIDMWKDNNRELLSGYYKSKGVEISGVKVSLTEENQNGIAAVLTGLQLSDKLGVSNYPINFKAMTSTSSESITFASLSEFETFAIQFMAARQEYFK